MGSLPFALSVHSFINSVGADAGFASIIGLAILVLLFFAQARDTATLREQLAEAAHRVQQLEARVAQLIRQGPAPSAGGGTQPPVTPPPVTQPPASRPSAASQVPDATQLSAPPRREEAAPARSAPVSAPASAPAAAAAMSAAAAAGQSPAGRAGEPAGDESASSALGAPAGVGAPALTAATRLIPASEQGGVFAPERPEEQTAVTPPPVTAAGGGNGSGHTSGPRPVAPPPLQVRGGPGAGRRAGALPPLDVAPPSRPRRQLIGAVIALVAAVVVVAALLLLTSGGGGQTSSTASSPASNAPAPGTRSAVAAVNPAHITVAVLNGTATSGLAHRLSQKLSGSGFKQGTVATASDQTRTSTTVSYMPGHRQDALAVASSLKLAPGSVAPIDAATQAVACPPQGACPASVVVTVGSDLASTQ